VINEADYYPKGVGFDSRAMHGFFSHVKEVEDIVVLVFLLIWQILSQQDALDQNQLKIDTITGAQSLETDIFGFSITSTIPKL
jgi:hypothetical protein